MEQVHSQQKRQLQSPTNMQPLQDSYNNNPNYYAQPNYQDPPNQYQQTQNLSYQPYPTSSKHQNQLPGYQTYFPSPQVPIEDAYAIHHSPLIEQTYQIGNQNVIQEGPKLVNCLYAEQFPSLLTQLNLLKQQLSEERQHAAVLELKIQNYLGKQQEINDKCAAMAKWKNKSKQFKLELVRLKTQFQQMQVEYEKQSLENIELNQRKIKITKELKQVQQDLKRQTTSKIQPKSETKNCKSANTVALFNEHNSTKMTHLISENKKLAEENFDLKQKNAKHQTRIKFLEHKCKDFQNELHLTKFKCSAEINQIQTANTKSVLVPSRIVNCSQPQFANFQEQAVHPNSIKTIKQINPTNLMPSQQVQYVQTLPSESAQKIIHRRKNSSSRSSSSSSSQSSSSSSNSSPNSKIKSRKSSKKNKSKNQK